MATDFFNESYGVGFEGIINWGNTITDGWLANAFIAFIFIVTTLVLSKSEWKMSGALTFACFLTFITSLIMSLFLQINPYIMFLSIIGMAVGVFIGIINKNK